MFKKENKKETTKTMYGQFLSKMSKTISNSKQKERWIGDSGGTVHITNSDFGMFNVKSCDFDITVGNQEITRFVKMGGIQLKLKDSTGNYKVVTLSNVRYVPSFVGKLFSISTVMTKGDGIRFQNKQMEVQKGGATVEFLPSNLDNCGFCLVLKSKE